MAKYYDANYFIENKSLDSIGEWISQVMKGLIKEHGQVDSLDKIHIIIMVSDKGKNRFNCGIHYPITGDK